MSLVNPCSVRGELHFFVGKERQPKKVSGKKGRHSNYSSQGEKTHFVRLGKKKKKLVTVRKSESEGHLLSHFFSSRGPTQMTPHGGEEREGEGSRKKVDAQGEKATGGQRRKKEALIVLSRRKKVGSTSLSRKKGVWIGGFR